MKLTKQYLRNLIREELNKEDKIFANFWAQQLYDSFNESNKSPIIVFKQWIENIKKSGKFNTQQINDLDKDIWAIRGTDSGPSFKQIVRLKILKLLNGEKIR